jgi:molybdopterin synthase catalytic subunit
MEPTGNDATAGQYDQTMHIRVKLFAVLRESAGTGDVVLDIPAGATAGQALDVLVTQFPAIAAFREGLAVAVNMSYVPRDHRLSDGDELALIPPVSGG